MVPSILRPSLNAVSMTAEDVPCTKTLLEAFCNLLLKGIGIINAKNCWSTPKVFKPGRLHKKGRGMKVQGRRNFHDKRVKSLDAGPILHGFTLRFRRGQRDVTTA
eukprot:6447473-Pyramimonas_sp.AAC.1